MFKHAPNRLFVVLKDASNKLFVSQVLARSGEINKLPSSDMGVRDPLLPSGTPPPLGIEFSSPKMRDLLLSFTKNFGDRTHITKRIPVPVENPSRGGRLDAHRARVCLVSRSACEIAGRAATCKRGRKFAHGASLAERRVIPSPKKFSSFSKTHRMSARR